MERAITFLLNQDVSRLSLPSGLAVLDLLRRERRLTGTREGCREGDCGACMVLLGEPKGGEIRYRAVNSCLLPVGELEGRHLVTIEGLNPPSGREPELNPIQRCFVEEGATQCGFCTPGFIVSLTGWFLGGPAPSLEQALDAVAGNLCRCTGYASIRSAVQRLLEQFQALPEQEALERCVGWGVVQPWMLEAPARLEALRAEPGTGGAAAASAGVGTGKPVLVAGGTDLFVQRPDALQDAPLIFLSGRGLSNTWVQEGRRFLGATLPMEDLCALPPFGEYLPCVASGPVRQRATVVGNLVNASPIGDFTIMLLALGASLGIRGPAGMRELALPKFFRGYKDLDLAEEEVVEWVAFPEPPPGSFHFEKVARRQNLDIASLNAAGVLTADGGRVREARLAAGGVAPVPLYLGLASGYLSGRDVSPAALSQTLRLAQEEAAPISDVRGSADYRRQLLKRLLIAIFLRLLPQAFSPEAAAAMLAGGPA